MILDGDAAPDDPIGHPRRGLEVEDLLDDRYATIGNDPDATAAVACRSTLALETHLPHLGPLAP